jgi:hypothetical protein
LGLVKVLPLLPGFLSTFASTGQEKLVFVLQGLLQPLPSNLPDLLVADFGKVLQEWMMFVIHILASPCLCQFLQSKSLAVTGEAENALDRRGKADSFWTRFFQAGSPQASADLGLAEARTQLVGDADTEIEDVPMPDQMARSGGR